jgi:hypothetical protein
MAGPILDHRLWRGSSVVIAVVMFVLIRHSYMRSESKIGSPFLWNETLVIVEGQSREQIVLFRIMDPRARAKKVLQNKEFGWHKPGRWQNPK